MAKTAQDIISSIKDREFLEFIAHKRHLDPEGKNKKNLEKEIKEDVFNGGMYKLLEILHYKTLQGFGVDMQDEDDERKKVTRITLIKRTFAAMKDDPKGFFEKLDSKFLGSVLDELDAEKPSSVKKYAEALVAEAEAIGVENLLCSLTVPQLQSIAESHKLVVESNSQNILIDSIMKGENYKKQKPKKQKPSVKKPDIKKGISKIDLNQFYRQELVDYCSENDLVVSGTKRALIIRILEHLDGSSKTSPSKKRKASESSKKSPSKKAKNEK